MLSYDQPHYDAEMLRLWGLVAELSEQLNQTRGFIASLRNQASEIKAQALHSGTGFALRRFNMDMSQGIHPGVSQAASLTFLLGRGLRC